MHRISAYKKGLIWGLAVAVGASALILAGLFYWKNLRGVGPAIKPPAGDIVEELKPGENLTGFPLKLPDGFSIEIFAKDLPGARVMAFDTFGNMWVSQTSSGVVSLLEVKDGKVTHQNAILRNLRKPHGLAFHPDQPTLLYVAEENKVSRIPTYSDGGFAKIIDLPSGGGHFTRTIGFGPDKRLYTAIGSSCNVCNESDDRRAKIFSSNDDGSNFQEFARGLRNSVFFTWHPELENMWATEMGRDLLGDDTPPDEINVIPVLATKDSGLSVADQNPVLNYGWPNCYGKNIHDTSFDKNTYIRNPCMEPFEKASYVDLQAHSAPLGLAFVPEWGPESNLCFEGFEPACSGGWPKEYWGDLVVAFHGSWNRTRPTGYKLVRIKLDGGGNYLGTEDFITGWLQSAGALGRPVDLKFGPDGALYVSDDKAGVIYRVNYSK